MYSQQSDWSQNERSTQVLLTINGAEYKPLDAVFHEGTNIKCGHYKTYLRQSGSNWISADDVDICKKNWPSNATHFYLIILKKTMMKYLCSIRNKVEPLIFIFNNINS